MRIRLDRVIEVSLPNMTAEEVATSTVEVRRGGGQPRACMVLHQMCWQQMAAPQAAFSVTLDVPVTPLN